jgi:uncharacterized membrane protein YcaP (DUF421 family)
MDFIVRVFGEGKDLNALNMGSRALVLYFIMLLFMRISGTRTFSKKTAFDNIIVITVGALLSRVIVGASAFIPTLTAGLVLVLAHRMLAWASVYHPWLDKVIKGSQRPLYADGKINKENLDKSLMTPGDLMEGLRVNANLKTLEDIEEACLERNGDISVIRKKES